MLKSRLVTLSGRDEGLTVRLTELPALLADRYARAVLAQIGEEPDGGIAALAFKHSKDATKHGIETLLPFIDGAIIPKTEVATGRALNIARDIKDWRNVERLQQMALLLHVEFLLKREALEIPVKFQADQILSGGGLELRATFCSPQISTVLNAGKATYRELETVLSTEDVYNLCEIVNIAAIREWQAYQETK